MTAVLDHGAAAPERSCFALAPAGTGAAWIERAGAGIALGTSWDPGPARALAFHGSDRGGQLLVLGGGRVLVLRHHDGRHGIAIADRTGGVRHLCDLEGAGARLLDPPPGAGRRSTLAHVATYDHERGSAIWRLGRDGALTCIGADRGLLGGGVWLDAGGRQLALERIRGDEPVRPVALDVGDGSWTELFSVSRASNDRVLACDPTSGLFVASTDATGEPRVGTGIPGRRPLRFPDSLAGPIAEGRALAVEAGGGRVLLCGAAGATTRVAVHTPEDGALRPVPAPPGVLVAPPRWGRGRPRFVWSTPARPAHVVALDRAARVWPAPARDAGRWAEARLVQLEGAAGRIEAIVYGGAAWRDADHVAIALHGGPVAAWRFGFDPLFQTLSAAGVAVVAPNQRGSAGYGAAHAGAIRGAWGGPDLADVLALARHIGQARAAAGRSLPTVLGVSYGAFLAVLAAAAAPAAFAGVAALAPFTSPARLDRDGPASVRQLLRRMDALAPQQDELGERDLLRLAGAITAPLLVLHGSLDDHIPVLHGRRLRHRLLELGRREGRDFAYLEIAGAGHDVLRGARRAELHRRIAGFCRSPRAALAGPAEACA